MTTVVWTSLLLRVVSPEDYDYDPCDIHASLEDMSCSLRDLPPPPQTSGGHVKICCENGGWLFEAEYLWFEDENSCKDKVRWDQISLSGVSCTIVLQ